MLNLTQTTLKKLLQLLVPQVTNDTTREALLYEALGPNERARTLISSVNNSGSPRDFTTNLIMRLADYGTVTDNEHGEIHALWAVMLAVRERVGEDRQRTIDALAPELNPITALPVVEISDTPQIVSDGAHVFISYSRDDLSLVNRMVADLTAVGVPLWVDHVGLKAGTPDWEHAIRSAIREAHCVFLAASPTSQRSAYVRDELAIADMYEVPIYPLWVDGEQWMDCIPMGRGYTQHIDLRGEAYSTNFANLLAVVGESASPVEQHKPETAAPAPDFVPRNPYKGLRAFTEEDRADFFGREALVTKLVDALPDHRFLAIIGPSGSGKSSVAMAGLLPALQEDGALHGSTAWVYLPPIVPGAKPLDALRRALASVLPHKGQTAIREDLAHESTEGLAMLADEAADYDPDRRVVLYIDQFEELFTLTNADADRDQFVNLLTTALNDPDNVLTVVVTLRADFAYLLSAYAELAALAEKNTVYVPPMRINDLYTIISRPAAADDVHLTFESGLVEEIVFAFREEYAASTGTLPLLQFTLERLFAERDALQLTWAAYNSMGGVQGAIGTHAEAVFTDMDEDTQSAFSRVFMRLISVDERGTPTRQRAELDTLTDDDNAATLVRAFTDNRLLVTGTTDDDTRYAEVAHEALLNNWTRLVEWTQTIEDKLRLIREVERAAATWQAAGQPEYLLWKHERMEAVYAAQEELGYTFTGVASKFVRPEWEVLLDQFKLIVAEAWETHEIERATGSRPPSIFIDIDIYRVVPLIDRMGDIGGVAANALMEAWRIAATGQNGVSLFGFSEASRTRLRRPVSSRIDDLEARFHTNIQRIVKQPIKMIYAIIENEAPEALTYHALQFVLFLGPELTHLTFFTTILESRYDSVRILASDNLIESKRLGRGKLTGWAEHTDLRLLLERLHDSNAQVAVNVIKVMGVMGENTAVEPLLVLLNRDNVGVRAAATNALGQIGDKRAVEPLIALLQDNRTPQFDFDTNEIIAVQAAEALGEIGDERAVEPLIGVLGDDNPKLREASIKALGQIGDKRAVEPLIPLLQDRAKQDKFRRGEHDTIAVLVASVLGRIGDERAVEPLIGVLGDENPKLRQAAINALGEIGGEATPLLISMLGDDNAKRREAAINALGEIGDERAVEPLIDILRDENPTLREAAINALGEIGDKRAVEPLIPLLQDRTQQEDAFDASETIASLVAGVLGKLKDERAVEPLIAVMEDENVNLREAAINALGEIGDKRAVEPLIPLLQDRTQQAGPFVHKNDTIAVRSAVALGKIGDARAVEPLIAVLGDENPKLRRAAVEAMGKIGDERAVEPLIDILGDENPTLRMAAIVALGEIGDERAVATLIPLLHDQTQQADPFADENDTIAVRSAVALGKIGDERAVEPIFAAISNEESDEVKWIYRATLILLGDTRFADDMIDYIRTTESSTFLFDSSPFESSFSLRPILRSAIEQSDHPGLKALLEEQRQAWEAKQQAESGTDES